MRKYLVMEYFGGEFKLIEVKKTGKHYEIIKYMKTDVYSPESPESEIITRLKEAEIKAEKVVFVSKSSALKNMIKHFPNMPKKELKLVIDREVKKETKDEKVFYDYIVLEKKAGRIGTEKEVLISIAPEELIWKTFSFIRDMEKAPFIITSFYQSFISARKFVKIEEEKNTFGVLNISTKKSSFLIFKGDSEYVLEREIISSGENIFVGESIETLIMEINRTVQYFKQKNRGYEISNIYITGSFDGIEEVASALNDMLPFSVSPLPAETIIKFFRVNLKDGEDPQKFVSEYFSLFGGIFVPNEKNKINLLPSYYYEKESFKKRIISFSITSSLLLLILLLSTFFIEKTKNNLKKDLKEQQTAIVSISNRLQQMENIKTLRKKYYEELNALGIEKQSVEKLILFFNFLTLNTPEGIHLTRCTITRDGINYKISVEGVTDSILPFVGNQLFKSFYDKLSAYPLLTDFSFSLTQKDMRGEGTLNKVVDTMKDISEQITPSENQKEEKKQKLSFKISFKVNVL